MRIGILSFVYLLLAVIAFFWGYRVNRDAVTRQKIRWVVFAALVSGISGLVLWVLPSDVFGHPIISINVMGLLALPFPVSVAIAILRHRPFFPRRKQEDWLSREPAVCHRVQVDATIARQMSAA